MELTQEKFTTFIDTIVSAVNKILLRQDRVRMTLHVATATKKLNINNFIIFASFTIAVFSKSCCRFLVVAVAPTASADIASYLYKQASLHAPTKPCCFVVCIKRCHMSPIKGNNVIIMNSCNTSTTKLFPRYPFPKDSFSLVFDCLVRK